MSPSIGVTNKFVLKLSVSSDIPANSSNLCKVFASSPVVSVILFAALPVGAHNTGFIPCFLYNSIIALIIVVFPVPGPPVIIHTLCSFMLSIASLCFSESSISILSSIILKSSLSVLILLTLSAFLSPTIFSAMFFSAS